MDAKKKMKSQMILIWITIVSLIIVVIFVSFAWLSISSSPIVTPIDGDFASLPKVGDIDLDLVIANARDGQYGESCPLVNTANPDTIKPVSTFDLNSFYASKAQNQSGMIVKYKDVTSTKGQYLIEGNLYIKSNSGAGAIYFLPSVFNFTSSSQALGALRLAMKITSSAGTTTKIFNFNSSLNGTEAQSLTVPNANTVVKTLTNDGSATYENDPSVDINTCMAAGDENRPLAGQNELFNIQENETVEIQYYIYLEGCDQNCIASLQNNDVKMNFGFTGISGGTS